MRTDDGRSGGSPEDRDVSAAWAHRFARWAEETPVPDLPDPAWLRQRAAVVARLVPQERDAPPVAVAQLPAALVLLGAALVLVAVTLLVPELPLPVSLTVVAAAVGGLLPLVGLGAAGLWMGGAR